MTHEKLIEHCLSYPGSYEDYPFRDKSWTAMRYGEKGKCFAFIFERKGRLCVNLKCDPIKSDFLRRVFNDVTPAYHMDKTHWNTVALNGDVYIDEVFDMISDSYFLIKHEKRKRGEEYE